MRPCRKCGSSDVVPRRAKRSDYICGPCFQEERRQYHGRLKARRAALNLNAPPRKRTTLCRHCGGELSAARIKFYTTACYDCSTVYGRRRLKIAELPPEKAEVIRARERERSAIRLNDTDELFKRNARVQLRRAVKRGLIPRLPCILCGNSQSEGHHHDYSKPFDVVWLCRPHHRQLHKNRLSLLSFP